MSGRRRRELADSFRLVATDEQWFVRDLLVGVVAFALWVAGTGALATRVAGALDRQLGLATGGASAPVIAFFAVLWLLVPALVAVARLRSRSLNLRDNVEQYYRVAHPAALLAPPAAAVSAVLVAAIALWTFPWYFALVLVPVGLFVTLRALAFSYRVYSFSHPRIVQILAVPATVVMLGSGLVGIGIAAGRRTLVEQTFRAVNVPTWITGTVSVEGFAVSGLAVAATAPVFAALAYVLVQTVVALAVRLIEPEVDRSKMRTGQRYPPFLPAATPVESSGTAVADGASTVDEKAGSAAETPADGAGAAGETVDDGADPDEADGEDDLDDVSHTRVFTPPADDGDGGFDREAAAGKGRDDGPGSRAESADETRAVPGGETDGSTGSSREHCDACGESFSVDTTVRFCPNCGGAL